MTGFDVDLLDAVWVTKDVFSPEESEARQYLSHIYEEDEISGQQIFDMPFLTTIDALDVSALRSLTWMTGATVRHVAAHPALRDGITDEWTDVVATLSLVLPAYEEFDADEQEIADKRGLIDTILTPERTTVIRRSLDLLLAGEVAATVIWPEAPDAAAPVRFMDTLEHALRTQEEFMGVPYPQSFAIMIVADIVEYAGLHGPDEITIVVDEKYEDIIAHEVAHTYWDIIWPHWITEGGAEFLANVTRDKLGLVDNAPGCGTFANIAEFDQANLNILDVLQQTCHYWLGEQLFQALHHGLGDQTFREGFARLYRRGINDEDWACTGIHKGLCQLRTAFVDGAPPREAAIASEIIDRYYGSVQ